MSRLTRLAVIAAGTAVPLAFVAPAFAGFTLDITISKTHTGSFTAGKNGTFTITLTANGSGSTDGSDNFTVTDSLPTGLTFVSGGGNGFSCSASGQTVTCTGSVAMSGTGQSGPSSISFPLTVHVATNAPNQVTNNVSFTEGQNVDQNQNDNTAQDTVVIVHPSPSPTPSPTKSPKPSPSPTQAPTTAAPSPTAAVLPTSAARLPITGGSDSAPIAVLGGLLVVVGGVALALGLRSRRAG